MIYVAQREGFTDAEGSCIIRIRKNSKYKNGWSISPVFSVTLSKKDLHLLEAFKAYFGIGSIAESGKDTFKFKVESVEQILKVIIPHFNKYPLISKKFADYILFKTVIELINNKIHLTTEGLHKIVSIKASINKGLTTELKEAFTEVNPKERPLVVIPDIIPEQWIAGFTSGEGCFKVLISESPTTKVGFKVLLVFQITQHSRDEDLIKKLSSYFGCGVLEKDPRKPCLHLSVYRFTDNYYKIIPFFNQHNIAGKKFRDFKDWCKIGDLINENYHLTPQGLDEIREIKSGMNKGR